MKRSLRLVVPLALLLSLSTLPAADAVEVQPPSIYAPGTNIAYTRAQQVMVADRTYGTKGTWARYEWTGAATGWARVSATGVSSVFGQGGVVPAALRRQDTRTTPAGTFAIKYTFGPRNPGAKMVYKTVTSCSWWVTNPNRWDYNRWRQQCGASSTLGEHLADYTGNIYRQAAVIGYNYDNPIRYGAGSGAGIFLHYATTYTGGCVGLNSSTELTNTITWLDPAKSPLIVIKA